MSTGSISPPFILVTSPKCFMKGSRLVVTLIGNGSTSDAQTGWIPERSPPKGKPPEPSKRLPRVSPLSDTGLFSSIRLHLLKSEGLAVPDNGYIFTCTDLLDVPFHNHIAELLIKLGCITD